MAYRYVKNIQASLRQLADSNIWEIVDAGVPTSGAAGTGINFAGPGSFYINTTTGDRYVNTGTMVVPVWSILASSADFTSGVFASGTNTSGTTTAVAIAVTGALTTDSPLVTWRVTPQTIATIIAVATTTGIAVSFSTTVGTAGTLQYALIRSA